MSVFNKDMAFHVEGTTCAFIRRRETMTEVDVKAETVDKFISRLEGRESALSCTRGRTRF